MPLRIRACCAVGGLVLSLSTGHLPAAEGEPQPKASDPILVLTDRNFTANPFGGYLAEILRGEGLVEFHQMERSALFAEADPARALAPYLAAIVAQMDLTARENGLLSDYVDQGGVLLAMRPGADLAELFGLRAVGAQPERLIQHFRIDPNAPLALGVAEGPLQYHGEATRYALDGAAALAWLCDEPGAASAFPAVTAHRRGSGWAVAFAFDLARSVVLTRQGNPAWKDSEGDTMPGYRTMDLFLRPDGTTYVDLDRLSIPQADETQRLLANVLVRLIETPLPRLWYLPGLSKTILVNTGDGEGNFGPQIAPALEACASFGGRFSVYLMNWDSARGIEKTTVEEESAWRAAGHEVGVHVYGGGAEGEGAGEALRAAYGSIVADLTEKFGHGSRTARNHTVDWTGWVDMAAIESEFGTRMDLNYCHYLHPEQYRKTPGYLTGTGLPQRLIDERGRLLPIYQATTHWMDEFFVYNEMTPDEAAALIRQMFEAARQGAYSAFVANIHPCRFTSYGGKDKITPEWPPVVWEYCRDQGIPLWSAEMLLDFVEARNQARFENLAWRIDPEKSSVRLAFDFRAPVAGQSLTIMLTNALADRALKSVAVDGRPVDFTTEQIKGIEYAMFTTMAAEAQVAADYQ